MSLLIKALQKAEREKTADDKTSASDAGLSLELAPIQSATESDLDDEAGFSQPSPPPTQDQKHISQQAAASMFSAKGAQTNKVSLSKSALLAGAGLLSLLLLGGGFYYYLNSFNQPELAMPKPMAAAPQTPVSAAPTVPNNNSPDNNSIVTPPAAVNTAAQPAKPAGAVENIASAVPDSSVTVAEAMPVARSVVKPRASRSAQKPTAKSQKMVFGEPIETNEETAVKVTRNNPAPGINPNLLSAYSSFNAGDDASAQRLYRQVLQSDVHNVDALLGMAAIAARQGRNGDATGWYGKVLEVEPRNSVAQAAMISVLGQIDPVGSESRIKNLLAQQPEAAYLHAALGNLYAEQNQWPLAQQAYFKAHQYDASNAEYAFNLAVSLDQLGKTALALQYYKTTLELLPKSGAGSIDRAQVESRIAQLQ
jgi:tetratricopeptide (TPR) repeat protein